jgi:hypothetical protein
MSSLMPHSNTSTDPVSGDINSGSATFTERWEHIDCRDGGDYLEWQTLIYALSTMLPGYRAKEPSQASFKTTLWYAIRVAYVIGPTCLKPQYEPNLNYMPGAKKLFECLVTLIPREYFDMPSTNVLVQATTGAIRFFWAYLSHGRNSWGKYMTPAQPFPPLPAKPLRQSTSGSGGQRSLRPARYDGIPPVYASAPDGRLLGVPSAPTNVINSRRNAPRITKATETSSAAPAKDDSSDDDDSSLSSWDDDDFLAKALGKYEEPVAKTTAIVKSSSATSAPPATSSKRKAYVDSDSEDDEARPDKRSKITEKAMTSDTTTQPAPKAAAMSNSSQGQHAASHTTSSSASSSSTRIKNAVSHTSQSNSRMSSAGTSNAQLPMRPNVANTTVSTSSGTASAARVREAVPSDTIDLTASPRKKSEGRKESSTARSRERAPAAADQAAQEPKSKVHRVYRDEVLERLRAAEREKADELRVELEKEKKQNQKLTQDNKTFRAVIEARGIPEAAVEEILVRVEKGSPPDTAYKTVKTLFTRRAR